MLSPLTVDVSPDVNCKVSCPGVHFALLSAPEIMSRGVYLVDKKKAFEARWKVDGKNRSKRFSIAGNGHDNALALAHAERAKHAQWERPPPAEFASGHKNISWSTQDYVCEKPLSTSQFFWPGMFGGM